MEQHQLTAQEVRDLEFIFKTFDVQERGLIEVDEVRKALNHLGFKVSRKIVQQLLQDLELDSGGSSHKPKVGTADFEGFLHIVAKLQGTSYDQHEELLKVSEVIYLRLV